MALGKVWLKDGREKKIKSFYPWVQREEVLRTDNGLLPGELTQLVDHQGEFLAVGTYNPQSRFPFRVLSLENRTIDQTFFEEKFQRAQQHRLRLKLPSDACREIYAEADGLPGLIMDRYGSHLSIQVRSLGMEMLRTLWLPALLEIYQPESVIERSDMESRREEGLEPVIQVLHGTPPREVIIHENDLRFIVPLYEGLKTGFYLDQRDTRAMLASKIQPNQNVLDLFCYSGAFSLYASREMAEVVGIDILEENIHLARQNAELNHLKAEFTCANAFEWLVEAEKLRYQAHWILLDPPAIAKTGDQKDSLKWAIWKLIYHSLPILSSGGQLVVSSCSYQMSTERLMQTVRLAASDRGRKIFLEAQTLQGPDHPVMLQFPESLYLKTLWLRVE